MIKRKVLSFMILFFAFVAILMIVEILEFGTILGFAINDRFANLDYDFGNLGSYVLIFICMFFIVLAVVKMNKYNDNVRKLKNNYRNGLIKLDLN